MSRQQILSSVKTIILALIIGLGVSYVAAQVPGWTPPPPPAPPQNNTPAPLNVGTGSQVKVGSLGLNTLLLTGKGNSMQDFCIVGLFGVETKCLSTAGGGGASLIGPLTDNSADTHTQQVTFTLPASSDVLVQAYANVGIPNAVSSTLTLEIDGIPSDKANISDAAISGGGTHSVATLSKRITLNAGTHTLRLTFPSPGNFFFATGDPQKRVRFYVYQFSGGSGGGSVGPVGPAGPAGGVSLSDVRGSLEYQTCTGQGANAIISCTASCPVSPVSPVSKKVVGGGCEAEVFFGQVTPGSFPISFSQPTANRDGWVCKAAVSGSVEYRVKGTAICL